MFLNRCQILPEKFFFSSFKLLSASCTYSEQLCHRAKRIDVSERKSQCLRMTIWMISTLASHLPLHPPRQVKGLPELIGCQSHPPCKMVKQVNWGKRKTLESVAVDYHFRYLKIEHFTYINVPKIYIILHCFWKCLCYIHARKTRKETVQCHISDFCLRIGLT